MDGDPSLRLKVLGEMAATRQGAVVDLGGRRQRAVLAALVILRDQVVPAERLVDCVWGDRPPANGTAAIQAYVSHLRRRLQPEAGARRRDGVIASAGAGRTLRLAPETVDAWCFEQAVDSAATQAPADAVRTLDGALALWRGDPYAEYAGEPWVEAETVRLTEVRAAARERRLEARPAARWLRRAPRIAVGLLDDCSDPRLSPPYGSHDSRGRSTMRVFPPPVHPRARPASRLP